VDFPKIRDSEWYFDEFSETNFEDERLNSRFFQIISRFSSNPGTSISESCSTWRESKGAYRFFDNEKVSSQEILEAHQTKTVERISGFKTVLAIQDTTFFNFEASARMRGLGKIATRNHQVIMGLVGHTTFALSTEGVPLGILSQEIWARDFAGKNRHSRKKKPIEEKESFKWLKGLEQTRDLTNQLGVRIVTVADREADIYEFLLDALDNGDHFLIRACRDRLMHTGNGNYLRQHMLAQPVLCKYEILKDEKVRKLEVRQSEVHLAIPTRPFKGAVKDKVRSIELNVILVTESGKSRDKIEWMLLTDLKTKNRKEILEKINWYSKRWHIESWHKVLKSGCRVEECHLLERERLKRYLTIYSIVAWRIYFMTQYGRKNREILATEVLSESEWKSLWVVTNKHKTPPKNPPTLYEATRMIAALGGFLGRKNDGEPGPTSIWKGYKKLTDFVVMWEAMQT
jgi:hypothetical protein